MEQPFPPPGLANADYRVRLRTIHSLVEQGHPLAGQWIRPLLQDRESPVRNAAIVALGIVHDQEAFDALVMCLSAPTSQERINATQSLGILGHSGVQQPLLRAFQVETEPRVRIAIIKTLSAYPEDGDIIDALIQVITDPDEEIRATTAIALAKMRATKALPALQQMAMMDTNQETMMNGLWTRNNTIAQRVIKIILSLEQQIDLNWLD